MNDLLFFIGKFAIILFANAYLYLFKRPAHRELLFVYIMGLFLSFFNTSLAYAFVWWGYTSPVIGPKLSMLFTNLLYFPLTGTAYYQMLGEGNRRNIILAVTLALIHVFAEYLVLTRSNLFVYGENWNYVLTFVSYFVPYVSIWLGLRLYHRL